MALANCGKLYWPDPTIIGAVSVSASFPLFNVGANYILDATNTRLGQRFIVARSGTVTHLCVRVRNVTTAETLRVGLYTLDTSGNPTATTYGGSAYATISSPTADTQYEVDITDATMTAGDGCALVVEWDSTQGSVGLAVNSSNGTIGSSFVRYTTTWQTPAGVRLMHALKYSDSPNYWALQPYINTVTARLFNAGTSTADEYALKFTAPFKARVVGLYFWAVTYTGTSAYDFHLYEGTTSRASVTNVDSDALYAAPAVGAPCVYFTSPYTITAGTTYYAAIKPNTTADIQLQHPTVGNAAHLSTFPAGSIAYADRRLNGGAWLNDTPKEYCPVGLIIDQLDDGAGGSGGGRVITAA